MSIELSVEKSHREYAASSASLVAIDPAVMARHALKAGDLVRVVTFWRELLARVGPPDEADRDTGLIRLDRFQRQTLKARLHERVEVQAEAERAAARVRLQSAVDLGAASAHHLEEHLKEEMVHHRTPVTKGAILFVHFHHSVAGTLYKVVEVEGGSGVVTDKTDVVLDTAPEGFSSDRPGLEVTFDDVGGLDQEIRLVKELIQLPLQFPGVYRQLGIQAPRGIIFYGPPGTGKTLLVRAIANELNAQFYYINGTDIIGGTYGESEGNLRKMFGEATHHAPSVIFIDEIDALAQKRGETGSHADTRLVTQLLSLMDGMNKVDGVVVVATTNRLNTLDVALRRPGRFDRELYIGPPNQAGRQQILQIHTREMPLNEEARKFLPELAANTHGFVGADLMELCREAGLGALRRHAKDLTSASQLAQLNPEEIRIAREDLIRARNQSRPSAARAALVAVPDYGFEKIGGLAEVKKQLIDLIVDPLKNRSTTSARAVADGVVLAGAPGTGKSLLAKALAKEAGVNLIVIAGPELFTKWLGESEEAVRHVFTLARQIAPAIVFFDQLDALAPVRADGGGSRAAQRVVNQLLAELDALENAGQIVAVAATNRPDLVDAALWRPGRFGTRIELALPNDGDRVQILDIHLQGLRLSGAFKSGLRKKIFQSADTLTGADLQGLAELVRIHAYKTDGELGQEDLEQILSLWRATRHRPGFQAEGRARKKPKARRR